MSQSSNNHYRVTSWERGGASCDKEAGAIGPPEGDCKSLREVNHDQTAEFHNRNIKAVYFDPFSPCVRSITQRCVFHFLTSTVSITLSFRSTRVYLLLELQGFGSSPKGVQLLFIQRDYAVIREMSSFSCHVSVFLWLSHKPKPGREQWIKALAEFFNSLLQSPGCLPCSVCGEQHSFLLLSLDTPGFKLPETVVLWWCKEKQRLWALSPFCWLRHQTPLFRFRLA